MSRRALWVSVIAALLSCREPPRKPELAAEVTAPAPAIEVVPPDPDNDLAGVFPPIWRLGDHWRVSMVTPNEVSMRMIGYDFPVEYGYVVYEFHVAEVPADDAGFYRLTALSIRADDSRDRGFHVYYRKKPFSFERVTQLDQAGEPRSAPVWRQYPDEGPLPEIREQNRFIGDFPIMPDPPRLGRSMYPLSGYIHPRIQLVERTADGLRFTLEPGCGDRGGIVMDWKRGAKWWSSLGRYGRHREAPCEMYFNGSGLLVE